MKKNIIVFILAAYFTLGTSLYAQYDNGNFLRLNNASVASLIKKNLDQQNLPLLYTKNNSGYVEKCDTYTLSAERSFLVVYSYVKGCDSQTKVLANNYYVNKDEMEELGYTFRKLGTKKQSINYHEYFQKNSSTATQKIE